MNVSTPSITKKWWKEACVFQIYPASFQSTGAGSVPGWGDIKGITSRLDYLKHLGIDVLWVSPIFKSPQADMGYDISDYKDIDPRYGTLDDVDELIAGLKKRGMKLVMDLVVNHTSDQHDFFVESRSSKQNPKRDWYHWQPAKYDKDGNRQPPNNWAMILGEANSAWTWDETTNMYYLSLFTAEQPDLNWENPAVREAVHDVLRFWLERGASGYRMDVINHISKVPGYPDAPIQSPNSKYQPGYKMYCNGPRMHEYLHSMYKDVISKYDAMTVGEMPFVNDVDDIIKAVGADREELNEIFIFDIVNVDNDETGFRMTLRDIDVAEIREITNKWQRTMIERNGWNSVFIENHGANHPRNAYRQGLTMETDNPRSVSRYTDDNEKYRDLGAKLLCLMQTTLGGTLYVYQGEELGMKNMPIEYGPEEYLDIESQNYWHKVCYPVIAVYLACRS
jgi:oligo-1,6-glucosidase